LAKLKTAGGIILAGGKSSRMKKNKAFLKVGQLRIIERILIELKEAGLDPLIVTNSPEEYTHLGVPVIVDLIPRQGPLSGMHAGLVTSKYNYNLVVACDMPFIHRVLAEYLLAKAAGFDAVVPQIDGLAQPLFAVYSKNCIQPIERCLNSNIRKTTAFYPDINILMVNEEIVRSLVDPEKVFYNVNTPEDWQEAERLI